MGTRPRLTRAEWAVLLVLSAVQFTHLVDFMIVLPLGPQYMRDLRLSPGQFGLVVSVYGFAAAAAGLFAARFMDRFDRKHSLLVAYTGFTVATLFCAIAHRYELLLAARSLAGAFGGVAASIVLSIVGDVFPHERRGTAMGVVMSAFSVALIGGVPLGLLLAESFGWWTPFAAVGGLGVLVVAFITLVLPPVRGHLAHRLAGPPVSTLSVLVKPTYLRAYALMLAIVLGTFTVVPYIAAYMVGNVGRPQTDLKYVYLIGGLTTLLTMNIIGRLADRHGKLLMFRIMALLTIIPILLLTNLPPVPLALALCVSTLFMVSMSGRMVPAMALLTACAPPRERGQFLSVNSSVQQMASGLAAALGGAIVGEASLEPLGVVASAAAVSGPWVARGLTHYDLVGLLAAGSTLISVLLAGRLRPVDVGHVHAGGLVGAEAASTVGPVPPEPEDETDEPGPSAPAKQPDYPSV